MVSALAQEPPHGIGLRPQGNRVRGADLGDLASVEPPARALGGTVILTQMNVGRSLKATTDYLLGTLGGAIYAGAVGALVLHNSEIALSGALAITLAPIALIAAANARFSAAPFTAVMVFLAPTITDLGPIA